MEIVENKILLSICIPTFNRAELLRPLVEECLSIKSDEIEVVVSDNCSTDNTEKRMRAFNDDRFRYHRNSENIGWENIGLCIMRGHGKFCLLLRDKDSIPNIKQWFKSVKPVLKKNDGTSIFYGRLIAANGDWIIRVPKSQKRNTPAIYTSIINGPPLATSIIFPRKLLDTFYKIPQKLSTYLWSIYPHICLALYCAKYCDMVAMKSLTVKMRVSNVFKDPKAAVGAGGIYPYWFMESRINQMLDMVRLFQGLELPSEILEPIMIKLINRSNVLSCYGYAMLFQSGNNGIKEVERAREKPISYWNFIYWNGYKSILEKITELYNLTLLHPQTFDNAMDWYLRLADVTTLKEISQSK